jgi:transposase
VSESVLAPTPPHRPVRSRASARQLWVERLDRFAASALSPAAFCAAEGVSLPSFYSWKRRLVAESQGPAAEHPTRARLLPVHLPATRAAVELVLPSGAVLRILPDCDLAFVRSLVETLGESPC